MQNIGVIRETENGECLAVFDPSGLDLRILKLASHATSCLRFIDPYGDLIINQLQLPVLISELMEARKQTDERDLRDHIDKLLQFLDESKGVHTYIRFVGD